MFTGNGTGVDPDGRKEPILPFRADRVDQFGDRVAALSNRSRGLRNPLRYERSGPSGCSSTSVSIRRSTSRPVRDFRSART